jgi:hypothetical protein
MIDVPRKIFPANLKALAEDLRALGEKLSVAYGVTIESATFAGRDIAGFPKKIGAEISVAREGNDVSVRIARKGTQLLDLKMKLGKYNSPMAGMIYQAPAPGKKTQGCAFCYHIENIPDAEGVPHFVNGALLAELCEYSYRAWEPGHVEIKLDSSRDDPWGELKVTTVIGGAYTVNDLDLPWRKLVMPVDAEKVAPYLLTSRYDRTVFGENWEL